jgi:hypothetical protein
MNRSIVLAATTLLCSFARGQDPATTLSACTSAADVVVRAAVVAVEAPAPEWQQLRFSTIETLKGAVAVPFTLLEGAGACCGSALFALQPGDRCLLFLSRTGARLHPLGGARGVVGDDAAIVGHVRALLASASAAQLAHLLAQSLQHGDLRVRNDAAHALSTLPALSLSAQDRLAVTSALSDALLHQATTAAPLAEVLARTADTSAVDDLLPAYLSAREDQAAMLRRCLSRMPPSRVLERLPVFAADRGARGVRTAQLLAELPPSDAAPALRGLLQSSTCARTRLCAAEALLAAGADERQLAHLVPGVVLKVAKERRQHGPTLRSIDPRR